LMTFIFALLTNIFVKHNYTGQNEAFRRALI
jgi:hypothetical protein